MKTFSTFIPSEILQVGSSSSHPYIYRMEKSIVQVKANVKIRRGNQHTRFRSECSDRKISTLALPPSLRVLAYGGPWASIARQICRVRPARHERGPIELCLDQRRGTKHAATRPMRHDGP